jgi:hypothetical protein
MRSLLEWSVTYHRREPPLTSEMHSAAGFQAGLGAVRDCRAVNAKVAGVFVEKVLDQHLANQKAEYHNRIQPSVSELDSAAFGCKPCCFSFSRKVKRDNPSQRAAFA